MKISTVKKEETFTVHIPPSDIVGHFTRNNKLGQYRIESIDRENGRIELLHKVNFWSLGERVHVSVKQAENPNESSVCVVSEPMLKTVIFDYGVNRKNVAQVRDMIKQMSDDERDFVRDEFAEAQAEARERFANAKEEALTRGMTKFTIRREMRAERKAARKK